MTPLAPVPSDRAAAALEEATALKARAFALHQNGDASLVERAQAAADALAAQARHAVALAQILTDLRTLSAAYDATLAAANRLSLAPGQIAARSPLEATLPAALMLTVERELSDAFPTLRTAA